MRGKVGVLERNALWYAMQTSAFGTSAPEGGGYGRGHTDRG